MLSVVIPTRNRAELLAVALESIAEQELSAEDFEVLVIDNGSTDDTARVFERCSGVQGNLRYFYEPEPGLHVGRHRGLKEARGEVLVYADDDIRATPTWLLAIKNAFEDPEVALVGGNNYPDFQGTVPNWLQSLWDRPMHGGRVIPSLSILSLPEGRRDFDAYLVWGCNFSIRKQTVLDAGGFHPDGVPKELIRFRGDGESHLALYIKENNLRCVFDSRASVYHAVPPERMTFAYFKNRSFSQGVSDSYTKLRKGRRHRSLSDYPSAIARRLLHKLNRWKNFETNHELRELAMTMQKGHKEGVEYHQRQYREDSEVHAWVHKEDYF